MVIFVAIISHTAADAGYVLVIPLAGVIFYAAGRHPLAGIAAAFAGVSGGFSANPIPSSLDPLLAGITKVGVDILDPSRDVIRSATGPLPAPPPRSSSRWTGSSPTRSWSPGSAATRSTAIRQTCRPSTR